MQFISPIVSVVALFISLFTLWFSILRRGEVRSTQPAFIAIQYDWVDGNPLAKIFLRMLIYSTGKRGHVIESLFLRVKEGTRQAELAFWGYGDKDHLVRGGGLFVPETGIATNHHFNPIGSKEVFRFSGGTYSLALVAKLVGRKRPVPLWVGTLEVPPKVFDATIARDTAIWFNWSSDQNCYVSSVEKRSGHV